MKDVSVILPVMNETFSLEKTVRILMDENSESIGEIIIMTAPGRTSAESRSAIAKLEGLFPGVIKSHDQSLPFLGGAMRDAFRLSSGAWTLMMASDLETDPHIVKDLIREARTGNYDIVTASRWIHDEGFRSYNPVKLVLNFIFQKFFQILYRTKLSDLTYGFRIFRSDLIKKIRWEELRHPFLLETLLKPLRLGARVGEIPCQWTARKEGDSQNTFFANFKYFKIAFKVLLSSKENLSVK